MGRFNACPVEQLLNPDHNLLVKFDRPDLQVSGVETVAEVTIGGETQLRPSVSSTRKDDQMLQHLFGVNAAIPDLGQEFLDFLQLRLEPSDFL